MGSRGLIHSIRRCWRKVCLKGAAKQRGQRKHIRRLHGAILVLRQRFLFLTHQEENELRCKGRREAVHGTCSGGAQKLTRGLAENNRRIPRMELLASKKLQEVLFSPGPKNRV